MAKSRKPKGYVDPLDSIFGVIFGNAKSKPVRVKPRKINGVNNSEILARGLAEIAANPANYVGDGLNQLVGEYSNQVNLVEFNLDKFDEKLRRGDNSNGRIRVRAGDVPKFLTNPNKFIDDVFLKAKQERSMAKWLHMGRGLDSAMLTVWAKQQGFSNKEAVNIGMASSNWLGVDQKNVARKKFAENVVLGAVAGKLEANPSYMPPDMARQIQKAVEGAGFKDFIKAPGEMERVLRTVPGLSSHPDFNQLVKDIEDEYKRKKVLVYGLGQDSAGGAGSPWVTEGTINRDGYISILQQNMGYKARFLNGSSDPKDMMTQKKLLEAQGALAALYRLKGSGYEGKGLDSVMDEASGRIADLKKDLAANKSDPVKSTAIQGYIDKLTLQYNEANKQSEKRRASFFNPIVPTIGGNFGKFKQVLLTEVDYKIEKARWDVNSATTPEKRAMAISDLTLFQNQKKSLQGLSGVEWRMMLADMQGALGTIQATRDLPANILSGRFWNVNVQGNLTPSNMSKIQIGKSGWAAGIMTPRSDISPGYAALTSAYYLTPASLAKTFLYNGEGFAYLKYLQRLNEANKLNQSGFGTQLASTLQTLMASDPDLKKSIGGFLNSGGINVDAYALNYQTFMTSLEGQKGNLGGVWSKIDGLIKKENSSALTKLTQFFGTGNRTMMRIQEAYNKRFKEKINKYVVDNIISKWLGKEVAAQLGSKLGSLGLRQVITMAVSEWAAGIGAAIGGPLGAIAGAALTFLAEGLINKIIKPFIKLFFAFLWAFLVVFLAFIAWVLTLFFGSQPLPQQHIPPTDALECVNGNPFAGLYNFQPATEPGDFPNAPTDATCPIIGEPKICTQGAASPWSPYHVRQQALDIGTRSISDPVWYAPTDGVISSYIAHNACPYSVGTGLDYGGSLRFTDSSGTVYWLEHVKALADGKVSKGTPVAIAHGVGELPVSGCWSGPHFHLAVINGGGYVNTETWYREVLKCNISKGDPSCNG